jgi:peptidoglycan/LPS O-acetylase OafA/YrhL
VDDHAVADSKHIRRYEAPPAVRTPRAKKSGYLPSLDGWRALAILGVLMTHDLSWNIGRHSSRGFKGFGGYGVMLFFSISGILICTRILEEEALAGRFRLTPFYIRRFFRIQPAAMTYLAAIALLRLTGIVHERWHYWFGAVFLYANFLFKVTEVGGTGAFTGHFWTLAVEEHFYIFLSLLLFFVRRRRIQVFAVVIALIWVGQTIARHEGMFSFDVSARRTYWVILLLLTPSFFALLLRLHEVRATSVRYLKPWVAYMVTVALMLAVRGAHKNPGKFWSLTSMLQAESPYLFFGFSLWVIATMLHPKSWSTRLLELPALRFIGRLSYSIYLWHVLFFIPVYPEVAITSPALLFLSGRPWKYVATIAAAMLSYYLIERPLIRLGHRLAPPATPGHKDLSLTTV